ncbi:DUF805 domain-containing protein [Rhizobium sp. ACO-34A]|nr:DUF805 domain-containing protein [Rhizobium sp. ACO-34A]ATN35229.1 DUF805 domain-containing protein [Rhizobium sp. ACO-34A]
MGSFSIWHWLIVFIVFLVPLFFILRNAPDGANRFGELPVAMNFGQAIGSFFRNYVEFSGRASRSEFWYSMLFVFIVTLVADVLDPTEVISGAFSLAILLPTIAVAARRLHDINRSGWHQILSYFFPIGTIALIIWYCKPALDGAPVMAKHIPPPRNNEFG